MLIGLSGPARSGKDTIYQIICDLFPDLTVARDAFADRLKISAAAAIGFDGTDEERIDFCNLLKEPGSYVQWFYPTSADGSGGNGGTISGREYLQRYGTEAHRDVFDTNFWVKAVLPDTDPDNWWGRQDDADILVVTDVRFENEAERVLDCHGRMCRVERPEAGIAESSHASEQPLPERLIDHVIINDGTIDDLRTAVADMLGVNIHG